MNSVTEACPAMATVKSGVEIIHSHWIEATGGDTLQENAEMRNSD